MHFYSSGWHVWQFPTRTIHLAVQLPSYFLFSLLPMPPTKASNFMWLTCLCVDVYNCIITTLWQRTFSVKTGSVVYFFTPFDYWNCNVSVLHRVTAKMVGKDSSYVREGLWCVHRQKENCIHTGTGEIMFRAVHGIAMDSLKHDFTWWQHVPHMIQCKPPGNTIIWVRLESDLYG